MVAIGPQGVETVGFPGQTVPAGCWLSCPVAVAVGEAILDGVEGALVPLWTGQRWGWRALERWVGWLAGECGEGLDSWRMALRGWWQRWWPESLQWADHRGEEARSQPVPGALSRGERGQMVVGTGAGIQWVVPGRDLVHGGQDAR